MMDNKKDKKENSKIDYPRLNEVIKLSRDILKIILVLGVFSLIILFSYILNSWKLLKFLRVIIGILSPFFIGIVIAWLFDPIVSFLQRKGIKRGLGTTVVFSIFIAFIVLVGCLIVPSLGSQINDMINSAPKVIDNITNFVNGIISNLSDIYNQDFSNIQTKVYDVFNEIFVSLTVDLPTTILSIVKSIISGGVNFIFGLFIAFYMLLDFNNVRKHLLVFVPKKIHGEIIVLTDKLNKTLKSYVQGTLLIMFLLFICQTVGFTIAGLKAPMVFGLFCAITNVIPYIGPYIGGIPAIIVGFTQDPLVGVFCLIAVVINQFLESYFLNPLVMSKTMKLHPVTIMIGLLIFGHFFGILGMILSTPVISSGKAVLVHFNDKYGWLNMINEDNEEQGKRKVKQ